MAAAAERLVSRQVDVVELASASIAPDASAASMRASAESRIAVTSLARVTASAWIRANSKFPNTRLTNA
jgi:hypothetical protein